MKDLDSIIMDELYGILREYEMRTEKKTIKERSNLQRRQRTDSTNKVIVPSVNQT
jgi:hypothetical protein